MVSPSKTKHSRVAANQQQKPANASKVKLVKGPTPLVHHRFYLDIQKHQLANKIEYTIKELGGQIEFFLSKDITHFITDKDYSHYARAGGQDPEGGPSNSYSYNQQPVTPTTPITPKTPLSNRHHHLQQYVNEASPSSPSCGTAAAAYSSLHPAGSVGAASGTIGGSESRPVKPAAPRSRADAMLQRVRQQQQQQNQHSPSAPSYHPLLASTRSTSRPCSPLSPSVPSPSPIGVAAVATPAVSSVRLDRNSQSPAQLAKSWGKPIWSTEYAIKFLSKVIGSVKQDQGQNQQHQSSHQQLRKGSGKSGDSVGKTTPQHLRGDYIKIESHQRHHYRPAFALFKAWPSLNLSAKSNHSPFDSARGGGQRSVQPSVQPGQAAAPAPTVQEDRPSGVPKTVATATTNQTNATTATAKPEDTQQQQNAQQQCGYCEICRIEYDVLANHLNADEHRAFVRNDTNFAALDQLIEDGGVGLGAFLLKSVVVEEELTKPEKEEPPASDKPIGTGEPSDKNIVEEAVKEECDQGEVKAKKRRVEKERESRPLEPDTVKSTIAAQKEKNEEKEEEVTKPVLLKTYSRKSKEKPTTTEPHCTPSAKRTYAGRKSARASSVATEAAALTPSPPAAPEPPAENPAGNAEAATDPQMFGRRSAIHHHPHNTLNHHNHQKAKAARQAALEFKEKQEQKQQKVTEEDSTVVVTDVVMKLHGTEQTKQRENSNSKMGMKQSSIKSPSAAAAAAVEMMECDGLDPKNTKRISLGLRQNPKRANLNEDFTSLLDETLEPIRKPRIRRESVRRVNYSEPREDEIASQEELIESIILESTAQEAAAVAVVEESCRGKKKSTAGSPKRSSGSDVKIRGIRWRAPSPHARPPVKSPLLYKVIEEPKPKSKKNNSASPTKESHGKAGSPTKATKNGLIVKIRRVRQSELSLLNDEAENFMFPRSNESSDDETDEDRQTSSETGPGDYSQEVPSSDYDHHNTSKRKSAGTPLPVGAQQVVRKRPPGRPPADSPSKRPAKESTPTPASDNESTSTSTPRSRRAGVRGVAALLHDNAEYYKFPDPGSRLRFPEAPIQPNPAAVEVDDEEGLMTPPPAPPPLKRRGRKPASATVTAPVPAPTAMTSAELRQQQDLLLATRGASGCSSPYLHQEQLSSCGKAIINYCNQKGKEDGMGAMFKWSTFMRNCEQIEPYRFAFERVPALEPWYETFQRQDESTEKMYEYFGNTAYRKLPYEMSGLPPLRQNCCILNYRMKSKTPESTVPSSSNSSTCDGPSTAATTTTTKDQPAKPSSSTSEPLSLPLKKRKLLIDSDRPRKSPREHASTLAILSLLQQQTQHNRRRTISGGSSVPLNLPPPSPVPSSGGYSPKKEAIKQQLQQQEADSALGDEIRSSCGSDPVTEKDEPVAGSGGIGAKKIKFDPPIMPEQSFVNYKVMCQQLEEFLDADGVLPDEDLYLPETVPTVVVPRPATSPLKQNLLRIVQACDKEPPLSLKLVSRHESIVRKIVQYDRRPRPLSAISIKSFDGGGTGTAGGTAGGTGSGTCIGIFKKRINRTGWPNVKKRIVTRKQHQQKGGKRDSAESAGGAGGGEVKKEEQPAPEDTSRKSSTEESQVSAETGVGGEEEAVKQEEEGGEEGEVDEEEEDEEEDDDEDEFEDTMTMLDPEEERAVASTNTNGETTKPEIEKVEEQQQQQLLTDDEEEDGAVEEEVEDEREEEAKKETEESRQTPEPSKTEEILIPSRSCGPRSSSSLPSSKYVTKTTTTMTRIDYNVAPSTTAEPPKTATVDMTSAAATAEECDSISSRSIFVSDDCDTTSSTLINMEADPLALPCTPPVDSVENQQQQQQEDDDSRPVTPAVARARQNNTRHVGAASPGKKRGNLQPIVCLQKINCSTTAATAASSMRTRSSSRTPIKKTYKRSVFTSALVNSSGKPLKKKRKRKKLKLMNGTVPTASTTPTSAGTSSPSCSDGGGHNSSSVADEPTNDEEDEDEDSRTDGTDSPRPRGMTTTKNRPPTPSPAKFSPRKLRKPRGRWYRER